jgi:hypothetical protein
MPVRPAWYGRKVFADPQIASPRISIRLKNLNMAGENQFSAGEGLI